MIKRGGSSKDSEKKIAEYKVKWAIGIIKNEIWIVWQKMVKYGGKVVSKYLLDLMEMSLEIRIPNDCRNAVRMTVSIEKW